MTFVFIFFLEQLADAAKKASNTQTELSQCRGEIMEWFKKQTQRKIKTGIISILSFLSVEYDMKINDMWLW